MIEPLESRIAPAVLIVTNTNDSGTGSLRAAINSSNTTAHTAPDTIVFHLPAPTGTLGANVINLQSELVSFGNVDIVGPGAGKLIINAPGSDRAFDFNNLSTTKDSPVTISGLSIVNGNTTSEGGGIFSLESLTLKNVTLSGNTGSSGGGVAVDGSTTSFPVTATITDCLITKNIGTTSGGGVYFKELSAVTITGSIFSGNATNNARGGGIYTSIHSTKHNITIANCQLVDNTTGQAGSAAFLSDEAFTPSKVIVSGSVISGNSTTGTGNFGGGIYLDVGILTVTGSKIIGNTSAGLAAGIDAQVPSALTIAGSVRQSRHRQPRHAGRRSRDLCEGQRDRLLRAGRGLGIDDFR
jgi:hypothetical protein